LVAGAGLRVAILIEAEDNKVQRILSVEMRGLERISSQCIRNGKSWS
jgi:hypothetical protein